MNHEKAVQSVPEQEISEDVIAIEVDKTKKQNLDDVSSMGITLSEISHITDHPKKENMSELPKKKEEEIDQADIWDDIPKKDKILDSFMNSKDELRSPIKEVDNSEEWEENKGEEKKKPKEENKVENVSKEELTILENEKSAK